MKLLGIDFDNTIVCYDEAFYLVAYEKGLIPKNIPKTKKSIRDYLRYIDKEDEWTKLQGYIYGSRMDLAKLHPGINDFYKNKKKNKIFIISHKTIHPYIGPKYNLHEAARNWLEKQTFFNENLDIYFEITLQKKLQKIAELKCDFFIDDLPELLTENNFPLNVKKILFDPNNLYTISTKYQKVNLWKEISSIINEK